MRKTINDRILKVGTKCEYHSAIMNGTDYSFCGNGVISEVISPKDRLYRVVENDKRQREWIVQDINKKAEEKRIGSECEILSWIEIKE